MEEPRHPIAGVDYPETFQEFDEWFDSDEACIEYIAKLRWRNGFCCPNCGDRTEKFSLTPRDALS